MTFLPDHVALLERQITAEGQKLKAHESELLGGLSAADERARVAFTSAKVSLKRRSALEQGIVLLRNQLSAPVPTSSVDA